MNFGNNLKQFRKNASISQEELASKIGVTRQSVSKWETGEAYPEMSNIVALCKIFHCEITDLINDNITDTEKFDETTKEGVIKFKKNQQKNMKVLSKIIYIIANLCKIAISIPTVCLILASIALPIISSNISINEERIKIYDKTYEYTVNENVITIDGKSKYIETSTNIENLIKKHDTKYFIICAEYILICFIVLSILSILILHYVYVLYKNMHNDETPFNLKNEKIVKKLVITYVTQFVLLKLTAIIFSLITKIDLAIEFNVKDVISILIVLSIIYLFKYGRMIQVDTKAKIYD